MAVPQVRKNAHRAKLVLGAPGQETNLRFTVTFDTQSLSASIPCMNLLPQISLTHEIKEPQLAPHTCICENASHNAVFDYTKQNVLLDR